MLEIGHRLGAHYGLENSLKTLKAMCSIRRPYGIETDIQLSKDGVPFLMHDKLIDRTTTGKGFLSDMTSDFIQKEVRLKDGTPVPTVHQLLSFLAGTEIVLYAEIIEFGRSMEVLKAFKESPFFSPENVVFSSFNHHDIKTLKEYDPNIKTMALIESSPVNMKDVALACRADEIGFGFDSICPKAIAACRSIGVSPFAWTVNHAAEKDRAEKLGLSGIFSDILSGV